MDSRKRKSSDDAKPKKKKNKDRAWNRKRDSERKRGVPTDPNVILNTRFDHSKTHTDPTTGKEVETKYALAVDEKLALDNGVKVEKLKENLDPELNKAGTYKEVEFTEFSVTGTPTKGVSLTPSKTIYERVFRFGSRMSILSNNLNHVPVEKQTKVTEIPNDSDFFKSPQYLALEKILSDIKKQTVDVTPKLLKESKVAIDADGGTRPVSQNRAVTQKHLPASEGSAPQYVAAAKLFSETMKWEWLHLACYRIWHLKSQTIGNLVAGSYPANSCMMGIEAEMTYLAQEYPAGFKLEIVSDLIKSPDGKITNIASAIKYNVVTPDWTFPLEFNPQEPNKPHIDFNIFFHALVKALVIATKETKAKAAAGLASPMVSPSKAPPPPRPFFRRRKILHDIMTATPPPSPKKCKV